MKKALRIIGIISAVIILIPVLVVSHSFITQGIIPSYTRDALGIYMPYLYADDFEVNNNFTDSDAYYCFELKESEIKKLKADVKNNSAWFRFMGESEDIWGLNPVFGPWMEEKDIDFNNCYVALYDFSNDCFAYETEGLIDCGCAIYDEADGIYYYLEMIW